MSTRVLGSCSPGGGKAACQLRRFAGGETCGWLIASDGRGMLIDCPSADMAEQVRSAGLPCPEVVLHTQVQQEHCWEWSAFPDASVYVPDGCVDVATRSERFFAEAKTVWPADRPWEPETKGLEKYGVAGAVTERPPERPLNVAGVLKDGEVFEWGPVRLNVVALPGSGRRAIGLFWESRGILFSGDLMHAGGYLVNLYDVERGYGLPLGYEQLDDSLRRALALKPRRMLPTTGDAIDDPADDAALLERIAWIHDPPALRADEPEAMTNYAPAREFDLYRQVADGIYQNNNSGNVILFVDDLGRGLVIDPGICVPQPWQEDCRQMHEGLALLEEHAGLKTVELVLITHFHGDHVQYCDLLRDRYGAAIVATPDVAAVMERPEGFPYCCQIPWYGFPFDSIRVDRRVGYEQRFNWHDVAITPIHTPGHSNAHAGFMIPWKGMTTVCTGDVLAYGAGPIMARLGFTYSLYNDVAWPDRGCLRTFERVAQLRPHLVLGGHSHSFFDRDGSILRDFCTVAHQSLRLAQQMLADGDAMKAMTPPGFDAVRPPQ